jgi:Uma2 family endonuclease
MPAQQSGWTAEMARSLPDDGRRYEVLDGDLSVTPAPSLRHQAMAFRLCVRLDAYVTAHALGIALVSPADIEFSPRRLVQPDVFVAPTTERGTPREWRDISSLLLAVEILSPSTARTDRQQKRRIYQSEGVPEYWIVDLDARVVERWRPDDARPEVIADILVWQPRSDTAALSIGLDELFAETLGRKTER